MALAVYSSDKETEICLRNWRRFKKENKAKDSQSNLDKFKIHRNLKVDNC